MERRMHSMEQFNSPDFELEGTVDTKQVMEAIKNLKGEIHIKSVSKDQISQIERSIEKL
jgi:hypothetical protein